MEWKTIQQFEKFDIDKYVEWTTFKLNVARRSDSKPSNVIMEHNGYAATSKSKTGLEHISTKWHIWP